MLPRIKFASMQMHTLLLGAMVIAFATGCKNKRELSQATTSTTPTTTAQQSGQHATEVPPAPETPTKAAETTGDSVYFSLERTPCFGSCPSFRITVYQDGRALYEGRRFAPREGRYTGQASAALMQQIRAAVDSSGFYGMLDKYDKPVTDLPSLIIRMHDGARDKRVVGRVGAPQALKTLGQETEKLLESITWTKEAGEER
jgi:hypothetical protein